MKIKTPKIERESENASGSIHLTVGQLVQIQEKFPTNHQKTLQQRKQHKANM